MKPNIEVIKKAMLSCMVDYDKAGPPSMIGIGSKETAEAFGLPGPGLYAWNDKDKCYERTY
jgi:hypothetical protein